MRRYTYTDGNRGPVLLKPVNRKGERNQLVRYGFGGRPFPVHAGEITFECDAQNILEADEHFRAATGIDATKEMAIICSFRESAS